MGKTAAVMRRLGSIAFAASLVCASLVGSSCNEDLEVLSATYACRSDADCLDGFECVALPAFGSQKTCTPAAVDMVTIAADAFDFFPAPDDRLEATCQDAGASITAWAGLSYAFRIDRAEVTVGRFRAWVDAGMPVPCTTGRCSLDAGGPLEEALMWEASWSALAQDRSSFDPGAACVADSPVDYGPPTYRLDDDALPMTCVSWYQAVAFCAWDAGKRLPTDTEWQRAATGGERLLLPFTWSGDALRCADLTFDGEPSRCGFPVPVGSASGDRSRDGLWDLAGSVFEWTWDLYADYPSATDDYAGPAGGSEDRVRRGCAFICDACSALSTHWRREGYHPTKFYNDAGFRCARSVK